MLPLIVIAGPTASGKTQTAIELAKIIGGEVISADSMQVYRGMDIGTAKPTPEEKQGVTHHMIDVVAPDEPFSAAIYQSMAAEAVKEVRARGKIPILAGGTGFYINAVVNGNEFAPTTDDESETTYRRNLTALAEEQGVSYLHGLLREADPVAADAIHPNNIKRVARALSFCHFTGQRFSEHNTAQRQKSSASSTFFAILYRDRASLYNRINERVTQMFDAGLAGEVQGLLDRGYHEGLVSMQGLGYKETVRYLRGQCSMTQAAEEIRTGTRHYAKRQLTWFTHRAPDAFWLNADGKTAAVLAEEIITQMERAENLRA